jgi:SOS response regulatory protein OraA/RecX
MVVTALRAAGRGRLAVELDGAPWRVLPAEAVLAAGLAPGVALDRARARTLARDRRRVEARALALRALRHRDLPAGLLEERLERRGVAPAERRATVERLERAGAVDDRRYAHARAAALAARGRGDAAIRHDLEQRGLAAELVEEAIGRLEPEAARAAALADRLGGGIQAARGLARRGFSEESVESSVADEPWAELG